MKEYIFQLKFSVKEPDIPFRILKSYTRETGNFQALLKENQKFMEDVAKIVENLDKK